MMSGFDKCFQIAPCFRDEDGRADRLAEFYQLDVEMSFVTQDEVFAAIQPVIENIFEISDFTGTKRKVEWLPSLPYKEAMLKYGSDKPDLRNPLEIVDVTDVFARDDVEFKAFWRHRKGVVRAIRAPQVSDQPRSFFDKLNSWAQGQGAPGLGYVLFDSGEGKGPIAKFIPDAAQQALRETAGLEDGDAIFFVCNQEGPAAKFAGLARDAICDRSARSKAAIRLPVKKTFTNSAGLLISRCMNLMRHNKRSISLTTRSLCRKVVWMILKTKTRWISLHSNMTVFVTVSNLHRARSGTANRKSWKRLLALPVMKNLFLKRNLAACLMQCAKLHRRMAG